MDWLRAVCLGQGIYFLVTGLWPLVHMPSFLAVTGPKTDLWLVKTVAALIAAIGLTLLMAAGRSNFPPEVATLAVTSAVALLAVDLNYVAKKVIPPIYLADAAAECALLALWGIGLSR